MKKEIGIKLTKEQEDKLIFDLVNYGETKIKKFVRIKFKKIMRRESKRLKGNKSGFEKTDNYQLMDILSAKVEINLRRKIKRAKQHR